VWQVQESTTSAECTSKRTSRQQPSLGRLTRSRSATYSAVAAPSWDELQIAYLWKDEVKEALMDALGAPSTVEASRDLGRVAVAATLRAARGCRPAVIDSTWFPASLPLVQELHGPFVELRCRAPIDVVRRAVPGPDPR
jgi:hypothetical protein